MSLRDKLAAGLDPRSLALVRWDPVPLFRVHNRRFGPTDFNAQPLGNARFSPLLVQDGGSEMPRLVPTLYAGTTLEVALMETALHDTPTPSAGFILREAHIAHLRASRIEVAHPLQLLDFRNVCLRRLGLTRTDAIDCGKDHYAHTRLLAAWAYTHRPQAQGIVWVSRQDDRGEALVLFGDRMPANMIDPKDALQPLTSGPVHGVLLNLLESLGGFLQADA